MLTFAAHGEYVIRRHGRVARVDAWGPWNTERTLEYAQRLHACIEAMPTPFALLAVSHVQPILSPEAEAVLRENVRERVRLGCKAQATVLLDPSTEHVALAQYQHIYIPEGMHHAFFRSIEKAIVWLLDAGFVDAWLLRAEVGAQDAA